MFKASKRGMTLVEVMVGFFIFILLSLGVFAMVFQSRRTTEVMVRKAAAVAMSQAYLEQMKAMTYSDLMLSPESDSILNASPSSFTLATQKDESSADPLVLSSGAAPELTSTSATTWTCNNVKTVDLGLYGKSAATVTMKFWVWISDVSTEGKSQIKGITIVWAVPVTWAGQTKWYSGTLKTFRSVVPSF